MRDLKQLQSGISLLEVLLSIAIVAAIAAFTCRFIQVTLVNTSITETVTRVNKLVKSSYDWLQQQRVEDFLGNPDGSGESGITASKLVSSGLAQPRDLKTAWGNISITAAPQDPRRIAMTLDHLPSGICHNLERRIPQATSNAHCQGQQLTWIF